MNSKKINDLKDRFKKLDKFENYDEKIEHEKMVSMFSFLSDVQKIIDKRGWTRKKLAKEIGISASYLSQLYSGDKVINLELITKISKALDCSFKINLNTPELSYDRESLKMLERQKVKESQDRGFWVYHNLKKPTYNEDEKFVPKTSKKLTA